MKQKFVRQAIEDAMGRYAMGGLTIREATDQAMDSINGADAFNQGPHPEDHAFVQDAVESDMCGLCGWEEKDLLSPEILLAGAEATLRAIEEVIPRNDAHRDYSETVTLEVNFLRGIKERHDAMLVGGQAVRAIPDSAKTASMAEVHAAANKEWAHDKRVWRIAELLMTHVDGIKRPQAEVCAKKLIQVFNEGGVA